MTLSSDCRNITYSGRMELCLLADLFPFIHTSPRTPWWYCLIQGRSFPFSRSPSCESFPGLSSQTLPEMCFTDSHTRFSPCYDKIANMNNPWKEGFIWVCCFIGFSSQFLILGYGGRRTRPFISCSVKSREQDRHVGPYITFQDMPSSVLFHLVRLQLLKFLQPLLILNWLLPCATCEPIEGHFILSHNVLPCSLKTPGYILMQNIFSLFSSHYSLDISSFI